MDTNKLETQTSVESTNDTNAEVIKLTNNSTINIEINADTKTPTPTPINFGTTDTSFMFFSSSSRLTYKSHSGKIRKPGANYVFKQENIKSYTDTHGIVYNINDHVYMDINKPNQPFAIACVLDFKLTKRDNVVIEVRWYYRPNEIPDGVYMPLMQDRVTENHISSELIEPIIKGRELFASESRDIYPATFIKGKCRVFHFQDILEAKNFKPFADTFFCILTYNPEARRLANIQGEIRVGASHQVKLPACETYRDSKELTELCNSWETCLWKCKSIKDNNLYTYLQASRSIAAFAGICDRGNMDDMYEAAQSDSTTLHAMTVLHEMNYDTDKALKMIVKTNQTAKMIEKKWNDEDQKKFVKGLSQFGKNFFRIRKELLPHKDTSQLIEFYYMWKKTSSAQQNRFRRRIRPSSAKKLTNSAMSNKKTSSTSINTISTSNESNNNNISNNNNNNEQFSGGSDMDSDNDSDESSDPKQQSTTSQPKCCSNCFTNASTDLQNGGPDNQLLCYDCRMFYKKYGELPKIANEKTNNKLECNLLKRITEEDEFTNNCDKECAETISKNVETSNNINKTLTPSVLNASPIKNGNTEQKTESPQRSISAISDQENVSVLNNYKSSTTPVSSVQNESNCESNCTTPDLPADQLVDDDLYQVPKQINFIFNKPLENIKPDSNAMFARVWDRGFNSCCRTDVQFRYLPNAKYIRSSNERKSQKEAKNTITTNNNTNNGTSNGNMPYHEPHSIPAPIMNHTNPVYQPPNFNFNFKDIYNNPEEFQANLMNKLLMPPGPNQAQFNNIFNNNMNNFHAFNKPRPQMHPENMNQQQLLHMEQLAKMNAQNMNFPPSFLNSNNHNLAHFNDKNNLHHYQQQQQQQQQQHQQATHMPKYPFEFDLNPALRQLRDIADKSNLINSFAGLNNNPMFNYFQQ